MTRIILEDGPEAMEFDTQSESRPVRHTPNPKPWRWVNKTPAFSNPKPTGDQTPCKIPQP